MTLNIKDQIKIQNNTNKQKIKARLSLCRLPERPHRRSSRVLCFLESTSESHCPVLVCQRLSGSHIPVRTGVCSGDTPSTSLTNDRAMTVSLSVCSSAVHRRPSSPAPIRLTGTSSAAQTRCCLCPPAERHITHVSVKESWETELCM